MNPTTYVLSTLGYTVFIFLLSGVGGLLCFLAVRWAAFRIFDLGVDLFKAFQEPESDARFEDSPDLSETGISREIANLPPGSQLVEVDTAGMLTPPQHVLVHEYVWTGSAVEFVRTRPLCEFDFMAPSAALYAASHPDALAAREQFLRSFEVR